MFNADENAHFVPRAIGMFGHSLNPDYFINPPAYTYLLHFAYWLWWGSREALGDAFATDPATAFTIARVLSAVLGAAAVGFLAWAGRRLFDWRVGLLAGALLAVAFLPVHYAHLAVNDVPALAPLCLSLVGVAGVYRRGHLVDYALAGAALGVACATKYTAGIVVLCLVAAAASRVMPATQEARAGRTRCSAWPWPPCSRSPDSSSRTPTRCSTGTPSGRASSSSRRRRATAAASSAWSARAAFSTTSARSPGGSAGCRRWPRPPVPSGSRCATAGSRSCWCRRRSCS